MSLLQLDRLREIGRELAASRERRMRQRHQARRQRLGVVTRQRGAETILHSGRAMAAKIYRIGFKRMTRFSHEEYL